MLKNKLLNNILFKICILTAVMIISVTGSLQEIQVEAVNETDTFHYDGTNATSYNGETVFVITDKANEGIAGDMYSDEVAIDLSIIENKLKKVKIIRIDDTVTDLFMYMLKSFGQANTLQIGKNVSSIHMGNEEDIRIEDYIVKLDTIEVNDENEHFTVVDNVLYSYDMKILILYPPGKIDTYFSMPNTVTTLKRSYMANSSLQKLKLGRSFGPLDTPYRDNGDFFYSFTDGLSSLKKIIVDKENVNLTTENGVLYNKTKTKTIAWPKNLRIKHVTFPDTLQSIALSMISNKEEVKKITLSKDMEKLWVTDFLSLLRSFTNLEKISVPVENKYYTVWKGGLYYKKSWIFCGFPQKSSLTILEFPEGCTSIELRGSEYPNIETIKLPSTFTEFDTHEGGGFTTFYKMFPKLKNILISSSCKTYKSVDGIVFNKKGTQLIAYPVQKKDNSYRIPDSVTKIERNVFSGNQKLKILTIGKNMSSEQSWYDVMENSYISQFKTVNNCTNFTSKDGVLYDKKITKLMAYPPYNKSTNYNVPNSVKDITNLYYARTLENLILQKKVKTLCDFTTLNNLNVIKVSKDSPYYMSKNGVLYNKKGTKVIYNPNKT